MKKIILPLIISLLFALNNSFALQRTIQFSGYKWYVKSSSELIGPGPNFFSDSHQNVWLDEENQLHLKITNIDGKWYCSEIFSDKSFGYGKYIFYISSRIDQLDKNVVLGLFTWDNTSDEYNHREIDIEFARWGQEFNDCGQYVIQPHEKSQNINRFNIELSSYNTTHYFNWSPDRVIFQSSIGHYLYPPDNSYVIKLWTYIETDIPPKGNEKADINLWLNQGIIPSDEKEVEVVVKKFEFIPACINGDADINGKIDLQDVIYNLQVISETLRNQQY